MTESKCNADFVGTVAVTGAHFWRSSCEMNWPVRMDATIDLKSDTEDWARRLDAFSVQAVLAMSAARANAGLLGTVDQGNSDRQGVCVGTALGAQQTRVRYARRLATYGLANTNPIDFPDSVDGSPAAHVALTWGLRGPNLSFVDGPNSAVTALVGAARQLAFRTADRMHVVVGDVFEPHLRKVFGAGITENVAHSGETANENRTEPEDAVLALVLERWQQVPSHAAVALVGFLSSAVDVSAACSFGEAKTVGLRLRDSATPDLSGVLSIAGAWLGVVAPMGNESMACQDVVMPGSRRRCLLPNHHLPHLAFVGPSI